MTDFNITLSDIREKYVQRGAQRIVDNPNIFVRKKKITESDRAAMVGRQHTSVDLAEAVAKADLVNEAVPEILTLKAGY